MPQPLCWPLRAPRCVSPTGPPASFLPPCKRRKGSCGESCHGTITRLDCVTPCPQYLCWGWPATRPHRAPAGPGTACVPLGGGHTPIAHLLLCKRTKESMLPFLPFYLFIYSLREHCDKEGVRVSKAGIALWGCDSEMHPTGLGQAWSAACGGVQEAGASSPWVCHKPAITSGLHWERTGSWALELDRVCFLLLKSKS